MKNVHAAAVVLVAVVAADAMRVAVAVVTAIAEAEEVEAAQDDMVVAVEGEISAVADSEETTREMIAKLLFSCAAIRRVAARIILTRRVSEGHDA